MSNEACESIYHYICALSNLASLVMISPLCDRVNINMSEYHDRHTMSRLIGAAPGYVGFEEGGECIMCLSDKVHCPNNIQSVFDFLQVS